TAPRPPASATESIPSRSSLWSGRKRPVRRPPKRRPKRVASRPPRGLRASGLHLAGAALLPQQHALPRRRIHVDLLQRTAPRPTGVERALMIVAPPGHLEHERLVAPEQRPKAALPAERFGV